MAVEIIFSEKLGEFYLKIKKCIDLTKVEDNKCYYRQSNILLVTIW